MSVRGNSVPGPRAAYDNRYAGERRNERRENAIRTQERPEDNRIAITERRHCCSVRCGQIARARAFRTVLVLPVVEHAPFRKFVLETGLDESYRRCRSEETLRFLLNTFREKLTGGGEGGGSKITHEFRNTSSLHPWIIRVLRPAHMTTAVAYDNRREIQTQIAQLIRFAHRGFQI